MDDEELEAVAWAKYEWTCPDCDEENVVDHDPQGESLECDGCGQLVRIRETR